MASDLVVGLELLGLSSPFVAIGVMRMKYLAGLSPEGRAGIRLARRAQRDWVQLALNLGLKWEEPTAGRREFAWLNNPQLPRGRTPRVEVPRFRAEPIEGGFVATVGTMHGVGLAEVQKQAEHLRNAWRCERVTVEQDVPGKLKIRALITDPLTVPYSPRKGATWA
ncbi:hypothetical protein [Yinghuangia soli]|uniref:Uncharacterized protein n=1 Tax=Yinghuangia soli TaxID=2908204 RepID=A0AA41Q4C7_9ACTN|nr:hypothetical protein [Yinghuangia soli]MCF2531319.1 hypothetical protein [Yinghuangia soli]